MRRKLTDREEYKLMMHEEKDMLDCDACGGERDDCKECCPHDWDDHSCLNCGEERDYGGLIDAAEYIIDTER